MTLRNIFTHSVSDGGGKWRDDDWLSEEDDDEDFDSDLTRANRLSGTLKLWLTPLGPTPYFLVERMDGISGDSEESSSAKNKNVLFFISLMWFDVKLWRVEICFEQLFHLTEIKNLGLLLPEQGGSLVTKWIKNIGNIRLTTYRVHHLRVRRRILLRFPTQSLLIHLTFCCFQLYQVCFDWLLPLRNKWGHNTSGLFFHRFSGNSR